MFTITIVLLAASGVAAQSSNMLAAWVELSPTGPVLRVVTSAASCPRVATLAAAGATPTGWQEGMTVRAAPAPPDFVDRVCQWQPPPAAYAVAVEGLAGPLRMPAANPRRIVVFGDSGCLGGTYQDCGREWYFADLARSAAARRPDLVIHLGDYNYRGTTCVAYDACCTYNPDTCAFPNCGDSSANWQADFFTAAAPLLAAAPWVMARGNHELCSRAGRGYFRYLDPHSTPPACAANPVIEPTYIDPYALDLGDSLRLLVVDSANACGELSERDNVPAYRRQQPSLAQLAAGSPAAQTWLISHKPMWGVLRVRPSPVVLNYTLQQAWANRLPSAVNLVLSGHLHIFQALTMASAGFPTALLVGTGGTELDDPAWLPERIDSLAAGPDGPMIGSAVTLHDHGYLVIETSGATWTGIFYDRFDKPLATCASGNRPSVCTAAPGADR
jgi:hypothetical protein